MYLVLNVLDIHDKNNDKYSLSIFYVPSTVVKPFTHINVMRNYYYPPNNSIRQYYYLSFTDVETGAQRGTETGLRASRE